MSISPTAEGFRAAFRRPLLTFAEISWRWVVGATATALFFFGLFEFLGTLPVTSGELLFLRSRQPYLVAQAIAHILHGSLNRAVMSALLAALLLALLWMFAASIGRIATVRSLLGDFRRDAQTNVPGGASVTLLRLSFLRMIVALAAIIGLVGAAIIAGFVSPDSNPRPELAVLLFLPFAGLICLVWWVLNWFLSLAGMFAVRDGGDTVTAISSAIGFCRERSKPILAVSASTGFAHLTAFGLATTVVAFPLGLAGVLPWRLVAVAVTMLTLGYFAIVDWLYIARLAGYLCIAETPEELLRPAPPRMPVPPVTPPLQTSIDRDELILSDVPGLVGET